MGNSLRWGSPKEAQIQDEGTWDGEFWIRRFEIPKDGSGEEFMRVRKQSQKFRERPGLLMEIWVLPVCESRRDHSGQVMNSERS